MEATSIGPWCHGARRGAGREPRSSRSSIRSKWWRSTRWSSIGPPNRCPELGTLDAIHLATALLWKDMTRTDLVMATHAGALALGAQAYGLSVVGMARS